MRIWPWLLLLLCIRLSCFAQSSSSRPAKNIIRQQKYIDSINDVVYDDYLKIPDSSRNMAERMLLLSETIKYQEGIARSYSNIGVIYWSQSYYPIALFYFNSALENVPKGKPLLLSEIYSNLGRVYGELGNYKLSMDDLAKSQAFAGSDKLHLGETFAEESFTYVKMRDYTKAIEKACISMQFDQAVGEIMGAAIDYSRLGDIYYAKKDYKKAQAYYDTAYRQSIVLKMNRLRAAMYLEYANINNDEHNYSKAMDFAKRGIAL